MNKRWRSVFFLLVGLLLAACGKEPVYVEQSYVFGTLVEVTIEGEDEARAKQAIAAVMQEFQRLHNLLHAWQPSELSELNAIIAQGKTTEISAELTLMLKEAAELSAQSEGLFNPAIGGLVKLWGFHADEYKSALPDGKQLETLVKARPQMSDLVIDGKRAWSKNPAVQFDLGGYAKGYALTRATQVLRQQGIRNALVNIGGNVLALGKHGSRAWRVGIQHPRKSGPIATLELHDGDAIGTSGDYQRYFEFGGKRYCHLIDPRSGHPVQGVQAVTVLTHGVRAGVLSDATSKPLFISGAPGWRAAAQKMNLTEALLIDASGTVHLTAAMDKRLEFMDTKTLRKIE